jgi:hypothetical protein
MTRPQHLARQPWRDQRTIPAMVGQAVHRPGNEDFNVRIPLVSNKETLGGRALKAIKTLDLDREAPTKIYEHGDAWLNRIKRLRRINENPERLLFVVQTPAGKQSEKKRAACQEIHNELLREEVNVLEYGDKKGLLDFAASGVV